MRLTDSGTSHPQRAPATPHPSPPPRQPPRLLAYRRARVIRMGLRQSRRRTRLGPGELGDEFSRHRPDVSVRVRGEVPQPRFKNPVRARRTGVPLAPVARQRMERRDPDLGIGIVRHRDQLPHRLHVHQMIEQSAAPLPNPRVPALQPRPNRRKRPVPTPQQLPVRRTNALGIPQTRNQSLVIGPDKSEHSLSIRSRPPPGKAFPLGRRRTVPGGHGVHSGGRLQGAGGVGARPAPHQHVSALPRYGKGRSANRTEPACGVGQLWLCRISFNPPHTALLGRASTVPVTELRRKRMFDAPDSSRALTIWPSGMVMRVPAVT